MGGACCRDGFGFVAPVAAEASSEYMPMRCVPEAKITGFAGPRGTGQPEGFCSGVAQCGLSFVEEFSARAASVTAPLGKSMGWPKPCMTRPPKLEALLKELFRLHDLNGNGTLEEDELVQLNAKVAMLHYGRDVDLDEVKAKYRRLFREKLNYEGRPVSYAVFRRYLLQVLDGLDTDSRAQEMIAEQFCLEAKAARAVFHLPSFASVSDVEFLSKISCQSFYDDSPRISTVTPEAQEFPQWEPSRTEDTTTPRSTGIPVEPTISTKVSSPMTPSPVSASGGIFVSGPGSGEPRKPRQPISPSSCPKQPPSPTRPSVFIVGMAGG
mmetsp:Transcript_95465/g.275030  ORF Transcript_95465/g.275030 Transcript_95465/m.275030 type:complete len:324 (+) Transcript_95465:84-1055(+)